MIRISFVIPTLAYGGAQMMLVKLLSRLDRTAFVPEVISLTNEIPLADHLMHQGIPVRVLGMRQGLPDPRKLLALSFWLRKSRPDLVQTWMYHADLIGGFAAALAGRPPVIWNIRHSDLNPAADKRMTMLIAKVCARLSRWLPRRIICCAGTARDIHVAIGYAKEKFEVIPNGFDLAAFRPDPISRARVREELGFSSKALAIGLAARFHPQKDHRGFVHAAGLFARQCPQARFVLCGEDVNEGNQELAGWARETGVPERFVFLGRRSDMPAVTTAFDIACSSSASGEAFSNTLGEAMACGVPCVATDVGDAAQILGDTGFIVRPQNPAAMAAAWQEMASLGEGGRLALGARARQRVLENFSLDRVTDRYESLYRDILTPARSAARSEKWRAC